MGALFAPDIQERIVRVGVLCKKRNKVTRMECWLSVNHPGDCYFNPAPPTKKCVRCGYPNKIVGIYNNLPNRVLCEGCYFKELKAGVKVVFR